jgi:hypothetical protein
MKVLHILQVTQVDTQSFKVRLTILTSDISYEYLIAVLKTE